MAPITRPRVEGDREEEILDAVIELLIEVGYDRLTMDAVATRAKASKATLYRRWATKPALVIDAVLRSKEAQSGPTPDTGSLRGDLLGLCAGPSGMASQSQNRMFGAVVSAITSDEEFADLFRERFISKKLASAQEIYGRAIARGEVRPDADYELIGPALPAVIMHRILFLGMPVDDSIAERIVDHLILPAVLIHPQKDKK